MVGLDFGVTFFPKSTMQFPEFENLVDRKCNTSNYILIVLLHV